MKKWGLALGGGGILGFAHIGVLRALEATGLGPSIITGTSAGALIAGLYAAGVELTRLEDITGKVLTAEDEPVEMPALSIHGGISAMGLSGFIGGGIIESAIDKVTRGARLSDARVPLALTAVDVVTGAIVVFTNTPPLSQASTKALGMSGRVYVTDAKISEAIRASISIPGVFKPKRFRSWMLVDGGIRDMVPVFEARRMGADEVVAVDLSTHADRPQMPGNAISILSRSFAIATRESTERTIAENASIILQPDVFESGMPTPAKWRSLIEAGKDCVEKQMPRLLSMVT